MAKAKSAGMPRWVKVMLWGGLVLVIAIAVMLATGHGPWQHFHGMAMPQ